MGNLPPASNQRRWSTRTAPVSCSVKMRRDVDVSDSLDDPIASDEPVEGSLDESPRSRICSDLSEEHVLVARILLRGLVGSADAITQP